MDNSIVQELTQKISDSRACIAFILTQDGYVQAFINGTSHDLMATIASQMEKNQIVDHILQGAYNLIQERKKQS